MVSNGVKSSSQKAESEVQKGHVVNKQLTLIRNEMVDLVKDSEVLLKAADEMSSAAVIALKGSESVSQAAQEQSAACEESLKV